MIPHIKSLVEEDEPTLNLLPHSSSIVYRKYKMRLMAMVWQNLGNCASKMFIGEDFQPVSEFEADQLVSMRYKDEMTIDRWFRLHFPKEELSKPVSMKTSSHHEEVMKSLGQEFCIALDVALAGSGCEGCYSVIGIHTKSGGQSNKVLMQRAIVDWSVSHPICCPATMEAIATLYTEGDAEHGLPRHRLPICNDERGRAQQRFNVSKVVDCMETETV